MRFLISGHRQEGAEVLDFDPGATWREVTNEVMTPDQDGHVETNAETEVWVVDGEEPLDLSAVVSACGIGELSELVITRSKGPVDVVVHLAGNHVDREFRRHRALQRVFNWAAGKQGFNLPADQRPQHELVPVGSLEPVDPRLPIAVYAGRAKVLELNLRRKKGYQG